MVALIVVVGLLATGAAPAAWPASAGPTGVEQPSPASIEMMIEQEIARMAGQDALALPRELLTRMVVDRLAAEWSRAGELGEPGARIMAVQWAVHEVVVEQARRARRRPPVRPAPPLGAGQSTVVHASAIPASERQALLDLYTSTNGAGWRYRYNWTGAPGTECTWYGVTCDGGKTTVQQLNLKSNYLAGTLPPSLGNFTNLQTLDLNNNQLTGSIPIQLGTLANLQSLLLSQNQLTGPMPASLGNLVSLQVLHLHYNPLAGSIPPQLGNLANLQDLSLHGTQLVGSIPDQLGNLANLQDLGLGSNQLTGSIPAELGALANLHVLNLSYNKLTGLIPAALGNLLNLREFYLCGNQLTGSIPAELGNLTNLELLHLEVDKLTGSIPPELGALANLQELALFYNQLSGSIPVQLGNLTNLQGLYLTGNQLTGSVPAVLGNLTNLMRLWLGSNHFTGSLPPELGNLTSLWELDLASNQLTGSIPTWLGALTSLWSLELASNQLTGSIPTELGNLTNLDYLDLSSNRLTGSIPSELGNLTNLTYLYLSSNLFTGSIPTEFGELWGLRDLTLSSNQLVGVVPTSITNLTRLSTQYTDFRWNGLYSFDPAVVAFLNSKQYGGDWQSTQTVSVTDLTAGVATPSSVALTWTPILYTGNTGGYQVFCSTSSGGPWKHSGTTATKSATGWTVSGLSPLTPYSFIVRSVTNSHAKNQNIVVSDPSPEVAGSTMAAPEILTVSKTGTGTGTVTSSPAGIDCGAICSAGFAPGTVVTLAPTADVASDFVGWSGACSGSGACSITMDAAQAVTASFDLSPNPTITSADHATFTVGVAGVFTITAVAVPVPSLSLTGALPAGVTFADNANGTGTLAGTPEPGTAGDYPATITANNGVGVEATQTFTLTVMPFETGDVNGDSETNVQDVFYLINDLFAGGPNPVGPADVNADGQVDVLDVFYLINYLFAGGPGPV